jgi:hypothetical protein
MEDMLELYQRPYDADEPTVCMDETTKQLVGEVFEPLPMIPGAPERFDTLYQRNGVATLFIFFEPLSGWRKVNVTESKTKRDWAHQVKELLDVHYPRAKKVHLVMDNLNTHCRSSLYEAFAPAEARRLLARLEFHYTPKHGSWLNMAEIELSILSRQCLDRRIADAERLQAEINSWEADRNNRSTPMNWRFTTENARIKLAKLYPTI